MNRYLNYKNTYVTIDAKDLSSQEAYRMVIGCVVPRPVAWITTLDASGCVNAAPFSSFNQVAHSPPMLAVSIGLRDDKLKDTARNIVDTGEFTVNVATVGNLDLMHRCSADYPASVSETEALGVALLPGVKVRSPRIAASPIHMECRLVHRLPLGEGQNTLYIGEILAFHLSQEVYDGNSVDSVKLQPIARLGGQYYTTLGEIIHRPAVQEPPD